MKLRSVASIISVILHAVRLLLSLLALWLSFGWKVRKARKAFEKELVKMGMARKDAKRLSAWYSKLKKDIINTLKASAFTWR
ncbi:MAG: hypothetical protein QHH12_04265 [Candidatus Bathyarchaeota archaeon]|jgi:hypothetical protein|nr:hypothetical protein [Candidatus Bathyarchaeota archaeon A05DMB-3]MDH7606966.1 hypothetical protein [Candidatus Bathyarchaeota archaeon]